MSPCPHHGGGPPLRLLALRHLEEVSRQPRAQCSARTGHHWDQTRPVKQGRRGGAAPSPRSPITPETPTGVPPIFPLGLGAKQRLLLKESVSRPLSCGHCWREEFLALGPVCLQQHPREPFPEPPLLPRSQSVISASAHGGSRLLMTLTTGEPRQTQLKSFCYCPSPASSWSRRQRPHRAVAPAAGAHLHVACGGRCPRAEPPRMVSPPAAARAAWAHGDRSSGLPAAIVGSRACGRAGSLVRNCSGSTEKMVPLVGSPACPPPPQSRTGLPEGRSPWSPPPPTTSNARGQGNWVVG